MLPSAQIFRPKGEIVNSTHENDSETERDPYGHLNETPILVEFLFVNFVIHPFLGDNRKLKQKSYYREQSIVMPSENGGQSLILSRQGQIVQAISTQSHHHNSRSPNSVFEL